MARRTLVGKQRSARSPTAETGDLGPRCRPHCCAAPKSQLGQSPSRSFVIDCLKTSINSNARALACTIGAALAHWGVLVVCVVVPISCGIASMHLTRKTPCDSSRTYSGPLPHRHTASATCSDCTSSSFLSWPLQWELGHKKPSTRNPTLESQVSYRFVV